MILSVVIALIGIGIAYFLYVKNPALPKRMAETWEGLYRWVFNKYYVDEAYEVLFVNSMKGLGTAFWKGIDEFIIDGTVNGIAYFFGGISGLIRKMQTGFAQNYALAMVLGGVVLAGYYVVRGLFF
jgi:NADH-quinone oxidoreductase subunit L